jgi:hypothetical protein
VTRRSPKVVALQSLTVPRSGAFWPRIVPLERIPLGRGILTKRIHGKEGREDARRVCDVSGAWRKQKFTPSRLLEAVKSTEDRQDVPLGHISHPSDPFFFFLVEKKQTEVPSRSTSRKGPHVLPFLFLSHHSLLPLVVNSRRFPIWTHSYSYFLFLSSLLFYSPRRGERGPLSLCGSG